MTRSIIVIATLGLFFLAALFAGRVYYLLIEVPPTPKVTVTIPEGSRVGEINEILSDAGVLLPDQELQEELEGYLFPDTYEFFLGSSIEVIEERLTENFNEKIEELLVGINVGMTKEIVTMASLIEREVSDKSERRIASGILWKRIKNNVPLQVDATICYIKGTPCLPITKGDKESDSLYNTYLYSGLPPGPINNPGVDAIEASIYPESSPYWYYLSDPESGQTIFAKTLDEHNLNVVKYLGD